MRTRKFAFEIYRPLGSPQQAHLEVIKIMRFIIAYLFLFCLFVLTGFFLRHIKTDQSHYWKLASKNCTLLCSQGSNSPQQAQLKL